MINVDLSLMNYSHPYTKFKDRYQLKIIASTSVEYLEIDTCLQMHLLFLKPNNK